MSVKLHKSYSILVTLKDDFAHSFFILINKRLVVFEIWVEDRILSNLDC